MASLIAVLDALFVVLGLYFLKRFLTSNRPCLPPGPKGLPLLGNALDMPTSQEWKVFTKWGEMYGNIMSVTVLGKPIVILNSIKPVVDMLEKKSAIYSDRPVFMMGGELVGWKNTLALTPYGDRFRESRRMLHQLIGSRGSRGNIDQFLPIEEHETHWFLRRVLDAPTDLAAEIRRTAGAIILMISHGYQIQVDTQDPFVYQADIATEQFSVATQPGAFLVDILPAIRHVPEWFPGADFKKKASAWGKVLSEMAEKPYMYVKSQMAAGTAVPSFTSNQLEGKINMTPQDEFNIKWTAASLYSGGADTTVSAIYTFFLAMTLYPDIQRKAQAEIDAVVGNDRLPTFADRPHLSYLEALINEVLRWGPVTPLGLPHRSIEDDIYEGYFIPKGTLVIVNIWNLLHNPATYANPLEFNPDRFIASGEKNAEQDPRAVCFGFGRRVCPGLNLADASLFISCAMSLAVFNISKAIEDGVVVEPVYKYTSGTISHPEPFKCSIKPRSEKAEALIRSVEEQK